ncbi:hypothetical protein NHJ13734_000820 [Beauveria thailandica]
MPFSAPCPSPAAINPFPKLIADCPSAVNTIKVLLIDVKSDEFTRNAKETVKTSRDGDNVFIDNTASLISLIYITTAESRSAPPLTPHLRHQPLDAHITTFHLIPLLPLAGLLHLTFVATGDLTGKRVLFETAVYRCSKTARSTLHAQLPPKAARRRHQSVSSVNSGFCVTELGNHDEEAM